ncbi:MAG TPA: 50S ribosomal protein L17 [Deltaproteobacteria bacterium]|nr:50S ribosomal protein L17 [Deltaproteobacteria bacterium]
MYHRIAGRKLQRTTDHRQALLRNLVTSLVMNERLTTTEAKAKELRKLADWMITLGKKGDLASIRRAERVLRSKAAIGKLFKELAPLFANRNGGYTRIIRTSVRRGDHAPMAIIEWTEKKAAEKSPGKEKKEPSRKGLFSRKKEKKAEKAPEAED